MDLTPSPTEAAAQAAQRTARECYGRLLSVLAVRSRDIAAVEDALSDAFVAALTQWPLEGVPRSPEAWLLTAAKRRLLDGHRRRSVREGAVPQLEVLAATAFPAPDDPERAQAPFGDDRLRLLFTCAHPAIDPAAHTPLMLQTVLGMSAEQMASAFRMSPKTLGQRLWRAKTRIRDAHIPFEVPVAAELPPRLEAVLEAIYGAFGTAWEQPGRDAPLAGLADEAIFLARLLVALMPDEPEPRGLLALMLFAHARRAARRDAGGDYVPVNLQDASLWDGARVREADAILQSAADLGRVGPFQLEAAIQSAHAVAAFTGHADAPAVALLYEGLVRMTPTLGACVARAAALLEAFGPERALQALDAISADDTADYQPYWAVRAHALAAVGRTQDARAAYTRAAGLTEDSAVRRFLLARCGALADPPSR